jgi:4'-phosphopantetheinyl transferase EntD
MIPWNISLSHSDRIVSSAVIPSGNGNIGIDLVDLASLSNDPLKYWLTFTEGKRAVDQLSMGILWSLKEAIYKATNDGNPFRPRLVDTAALLSHAEWSRINRDVETRGVTTGAMNNGWKLSLNVVDETIRALVWCPATRRLSRIPA